MSVRIGARVRVSITKLVIGHDKQVTYMVGRKQRQIRDLGNTIVEGGEAWLSVEKAPPY